MPEGRWTIVQAREQPSRSGPPPEASCAGELPDCIGENWETDTTTGVARDCGYISKGEHAQLASLDSDVRKMLRSMQDHPEALGPGA